MRKTIIRLALPFLNAIGEELKAKDENSDGSDDLAGISLCYSAEVCIAVLNRTAIPYPQEIVDYFKRQKATAPLPDPED